VPNSGTPEFGWTMSFLLRSSCAAGWIASDLGLARGPHINKVPQVGFTRLAVPSPAMTELIA
jgi:hypothetical protein